jgi:hypothetical protein
MATFVNNGLLAVGDEAVRLVDTRLYRIRDGLRKESALERQFHCKSWQYCTGHRVYLNWEIQTI